MRAEARCPSGWRSGAAVARNRTQRRSMP
ncbi:hypothetical protein EAS61_17785 [Bradyrhizobium zhanjiangense]|uniref:Uncharacterized protein n=1 Tax=Bradyrhizobium zhanjiangense TaxID=1325107 RepID=A0A4V1KWB3_9BRAD|nr:hypothetical protein EAS62_31875 [Bradyrhizobium zhanjiangense]RXG95721.1 hypothetical protein EAS61_17785 [Bradyrhizobium zhanjiangense]